MNRILNMKLFILIISIFCLVGCARDMEEAEMEPISAEGSTDAAEEEAKEETEEAADEKPKEIQTERREISIAYPFYGDREDKPLWLRRRRGRIHTS